MAIRKLGRGLDVLIPSRAASGERGREVVSLKVSEIRPNPFQPRQSFPKEELEDLATSIRREGLLQPVLVRRSPKGYQLIAGERRLRASKIAQQQTIPAIVLDVDDRKAQELALVENLQREDLNPLEAAEGFQSLMTMYDLTQDVLAETLAMKRSTIANSLRLLELPDALRKALGNGVISAGHAKVLLSISDPDRQLALFKRVKSEGLSVRSLEELAASEERVQKPKETKGKETGSGGREKRDAATAALEDEMTRLLGTKVTIAHNSNKGVIHVHFFSQDDFARLRDLFRSAQPA